MILANIYFQANVANLWLIEAELWKFISLGFSNFFLSSFWKWLELELGKFPFSNFQNFFRSGHFENGQEEGMDLTIFVNESNSCFKHNKISNKYKYIELGMGVHQNPQNNPRPICLFNSSDIFVNLLTESRFSKIAITSTFRNRLQRIIRFVVCIFKGFKSM